MRCSALFQNTGFPPPLYVHNDKTESPFCLRLILEFWGYVLAGIFVDLNFSACD